METPRVFIANYAGHDYTDAAQYGELNWITRNNISFQSLDRVKALVAERILETRSEDWLALSGTIVISVVAAIMWYQTHGIVKLLVFDSKLNKYRPLIVSKENVIELFAILSNDENDYEEKPVQA